jgi:hypothetical protein
MHQSNQHASAEPARISLTSTYQCNQHASPYRLGLKQQSWLPIQKATKVAEGKMRWINILPDFLLKATYKKYFVVCQFS